jgi:phosphoribosylaminoimidazole-succinocarboxamide synthase
VDTLDAAPGSLLPLPLVRRGKVREVYEIDADRLLIVASDRVSAFDVVMRETVPFKGAVLTQITAWWLRQLEGRVPHHMLASDADAIVAAVPSLAPHRTALRGRAMLCHRTNVYPVECVVRGFLAGSAWKEYRDHGTLAGEALPPGLRESAQLPAPLFSPASKAETGHDENITPAAVRALLGEAVAAELERSSRLIYEFGLGVAREHGIVVADTKFEFGERDGSVILIDEVLTPDSSRFWPAVGWEPGSSPPSYDKQPLRDYLDAERRAGRWDGDAPPPSLPPAVVNATSSRYLDLFERLTGASLLTAELS